MRGQCNESSNNVHDNAIRFRPDRWRNTANESAINATNTIVNNEEIPCSPQSRQTRLNTTSDNQDVVTD